MRLLTLLVAASSLAWPAMAQGQAAPSPASASERRLTPEQVEAILNEAAARRETAARPALERLAEEDAPVAPQVHGEVGFAIGTGGYREAYGTAIYPLGDDSVAAISLNFVDGGRRRFRH